MASLDEFREMTEEQRQQQHLDVRAVHVRIAQDADLAVAQATQVGRVVRAMRIDADGDRDIVYFGVGEQPVALHLPRVEHLAAQWQHGLRFLVAAHLGAAAGRVALDQEHLVVQDVLALAIGQLARQHRHARALALLDFLAGFLARLRRPDRQFGQLLAVVDVLVQPQLQRRTHEARHQTHSIARIQPLLDLALELRVEHLGAQHIGSPRKHVFRHQLDALGQQRMKIDEALDRREQAIPQAAFMRAAGTGRNQVDVAFAHRCAIFGEGHAPLCPFAFGEVIGVAVGIAGAFEQRNHRVAAQRLHQVIAQAALVEPLLRFPGFLVHQCDRHAGHQHRLAAQQVRQFGHRQCGRFEVLGIGPGTHRGALLAIARAVGRCRGSRFLFPDLQRLNHITGGKRQLGYRLLAVRRHFQPRRQRIGHADADAVQPA